MRPRIERSVLSVVILLAACGGRVTVEGTTPEGEVVRGAESDAEGSVSRAGGAPRHDEPIVVAEPRGPAIAITAAGVSIDGHLLPGQPSFDQLVERLGPPSRSEPLANVVHVYDDLGIVLLQPHDRADVIEMSVYFDQEEISFMPSQTFGGDVTLNGRAVNGGTHVADLPREFPGLVFDSEYLLSAQVNPSVEIFFRERSDGDKLARISIDFPH